MVPASKISKIFSEHSSLLTGRTQGVISLTEPGVPHHGLASVAQKALGVPPEAPTYWQTWQVTSDCSPPVKIWSMMQLQWLGLLAFFPLSSPGETRAL